MNQQNFITSHRMRVARAKREIGKLPFRVSLIDREAFVEGYLLEDIVRLYEYRLRETEKSEPSTPAGIRAKRLNLEKFNAIIKIFQSCNEVAKAQIQSGNYSIVWKSIPEHPLMVAAGSVKNMPKLREMAIVLLRSLVDETIQVGREEKTYDEQIADLDEHEINARKIYDVISPDQVEEIIKEVEDAFADDVKNKPKDNEKPNLK